MSGQDPFERLLSSLHAAALDDGLWPAASASIDEACGSKGNILVSGDGGFNGGADIFFVRTLYRGQRRPELEREYFETYHPVDERLPRLRRLADSRIVHVDALFTGEEKKASPVYNEIMPRTDTGNCLHARLDGPDGSRIVWTLADPVDAEGWTSERVETVGRLLPHLRHFVRVREALVEARALRTTIDGLLETAGMAVIRLDRSGGVAEANDRARAILRRCDGLRDEDGRLQAALPEEDDALQGLVARAVPYGCGARAGGSMTVSRERAVSRLLLHVSPVGADGTDGIGPDRRAGAGDRPGGPPAAGPGRPGAVPRPHAHRKPHRGVAGRGHVVARHRGRDGAQRHHGQVAPAPYLRQAPPVAAVGPGAARDVDRQRPRNSALTRAAARRRERQRRRRPGAVRRGQDRDRRGRGPRRRGSPVPGGGPPGPPEPEKPGLRPVRRTMDDIDRRQPSPEIPPKSRRPPSGRSEAAARARPKSPRARAAQSRHSRRSSQGPIRAM